MKIEVLENPDQELIDYLDKKVDDFNWANWEVSERIPLAVQIKNGQGELIAGATARSFGDWLLLDTLWVSDELRGQNIGSKVLKEVEALGKKRGCIKCLFTKSMAIKHNGFNRVTLKQAANTLWLKSYK